MPDQNEKIQRMLISRLEQKIEELKTANKGLQEKLAKLNTDSAAKIYLLEQERNEAQRSIMQLEQDLLLEKSKMRRLSRIRGE